MPVTVNMDSLLDKQYESSSLQDFPDALVDALVDALSGVSAADADALKTAFNIKTVGDLGKNKYFAAAVALADLAASGAKEHLRTAGEGARGGCRPFASRLPPTPRVARERCRP